MQTTSKAARKERGQNFTTLRPPIFDSSRPSWRMVFVIILNDIRCATQNETWSQWRQVYLKHKRIDPRHLRVTSL